MRTNEPSSLRVPRALEKQIDELIGRYPRKRSASLMILHAFQDRFGHLSAEIVEWVARKLDLHPINIYELVTFYPMFRQSPAGRHHIRICRTLSCALGGAQRLHRHFCERLGLDPNRTGLQTTTDGRFSVEFVECLASCGTAPVLMCDDALHEGVSQTKADEIIEECE